MQPPLPFPELEEERDRAGRVKRETPVLVVLGNPPYNGFAGVAVDEERALTEAYRTTRRARAPEGQGLNDLYVRFFRMAERRITERTGQGVICFISNYSWLDGLSFTGMRERYLEAFDAIRIDCLNGDKYRTGKVAPDGSPDPSIFSTAGDPVGIQVGTAIATLVRTADHAPAQAVEVRQLWGPAKRGELAATADAEPGALYQRIEPSLPLGLPFVRTAVSAGWFGWPALPELFPVSFPGVNSSRDGLLVDVDRDRLRERIARYFDPAVPHEEFARRYPQALRNSASRAVRAALLARGGPNEEGFVRFAYRPFDYRWLYYEPDGPLLDRPRPDYVPHVSKGNLWISAAQHLRKGATEPQTCVTELRGSMHLIERGASLFPARLRDERGGGAPNLSAAAEHYLARVGGTVEDLFHHVLAVLHDPAYREANAGALRMGWPRIPLPAAAGFARSAARGRELAALLDPDAPAPGVTTGALRPELAAIAVPATAGGRNMTGADFAVTAGWGHYGAAGAVMPGQGRVTERPATPAARHALSAGAFDVHLNDHARWSNVPAAVWTYRLGGYQVLKKWLSYRERAILGRPLLPDEVQHFTDTARRIAALLLLTSQPTAAAPKPPSKA